MKIFLWSDKYLQINKNQKQSKPKKMKQLLFAVVFLMSTQLFAQGLQKNNSSFESKFSNSGYGVVSTQYSRFNGQNAIFTGACGVGS